MVAGDGLAAVVRRGGGVCPFALYLYCDTSGSAVSYSNRGCVRAARR